MTPLWRSDETMADTRGELSHEDSGNNEDEDGSFVEPPQAGGHAGDNSTRGNDGGDLEGPHNDSDEDAGEDEDEDEDEDALAHPAARAIVTKLRKEAGDTRKKLRDAQGERDEYAAELWRYRVADTGLLADPEDLPYDPEALTDPEKIREQAEALIERKPHMRSTRITRRAGQGERGGDTAVSLSSLLRARA